MSDAEKKPRLLFQPVRQKLIKYSIPRIPVADLSVYYSEQCILRSPCYTNESRNIN